MSKSLNRLLFFKKIESTFSNKHGIVTNESRKWEDSYRQRWQHDKIVRSTHGVNCTGSCSWKIYVKNGMITWETQQTDYPETRPDLPNHEPRGCSRGASYSWYIYSSARLKHPLIRSSLIRIWREAKHKFSDPVLAWDSIISNPELSKKYKQTRGLGGFIRSNWEEVNEIIAAANICTAKKYGPDRIIGFSPIPAMSMVSYAAGSRYLSLIGGVCMSFYDWYCDLPPASPQTWGEQTDVPESADWFNSSYIIVWGSNVPQTRTPDAHFFTEVRYKGTKAVVICPDYSEAAKLADIWLRPKQGTDAAVAMAMIHVILKEYHLENKSEYFTNYCRNYTDMPFLIKLKKFKDGYKPDRMLRASDFKDNLNVSSNTKWKTTVYDENTGELCIPNGTIGSRWEDDTSDNSNNKEKWNLESKDCRTGKIIKPKLSLISDKDDVIDVAFPYFGGLEHEHFQSTDHSDILWKKLPVNKLDTGDDEIYVATVFDLFMANYGIDRGLGGENTASSFDDDIPYTPAWQEQITGVDRKQIIAVARQFAETADKTEGRSMIIVGAAMNHWYHMDMNYRGLINMLVICGCIGKSGGGWAHYVGQEKLRPQTGWLPLAFALDWNRPPRQMNSTSFFYAHTSQWRYEKINMDELLSPLNEDKQWEQQTFIDCNVKAERMGWLPSAPQLSENPLELSKKAKAANQDIKDYIVDQLKSEKIHMSCEQPDNPCNFPRNLFIWRSNLIGSSGKGHEYFAKYLLGTQHNVLGGDLGKEGGIKPKEVKWEEEAPVGKLDLLVTLDFRMSTTCLYSDIVLPTATWYEKNDLNTSDMHPFIHPLTEAINPVWESRSDWNIYKGIAEKFSELVKGHLGKETDVVMMPLLHDTPGELGQTDEIKDWKKGECEAIPGKTMPNIVYVERDYPNTYKKFTALGPLLEKLGNGGKGISWNTSDEVETLKGINKTVIEDGVSKGFANIFTDINAAEVILTLAPETNGHVAIKSWEALGKFTGREHTHLAIGKKDEHLRFKDLVAQPRKIISSPTWSGIESEKVSYTAGYTNVHELIPWRTLTGRQQLYQDHPWMLAFGEELSSYKPPVDMKTIKPIINKKNIGKKQVVLNFITPHQKWGIHSTYSDNLLMLTLSRGGPIIWISEVDAKKIDIEDNDWIEAYNVNGAIAARAVVSQRVPEGMSMMYHAQEKAINTPISQISGHRGGIHNSVTRTCLNPLHMIGGYAQLSYGFNYYGTVGCNRDEFVIVAKLDKVEWGREKDKNIQENEANV
ncbi:MAG: nitrate reductase subunit alpha [Rickettsiaceae bacterium]|nr:nitrate reductase subunit alpha [Rickettsiaceae bacterium]